MPTPPCLDLPSQRVSWRCKFYITEFTFLLGYPILCNYCKQLPMQTFLIVYLLKQCLIVSSLRIQLEGWGVKIPLPYGNQCLQNHIHELIALSSVNLTGKIEMKGTEVPNPRRSSACDCTCVLTRIDHCLVTLSCLPCACLCKVCSRISDALSQALCNLSLA